MTQLPSRRKNKPEPLVDIEITQLAVEDFYPMLNDNITSVVIRYGQGMGRIKEAEESWTKDGLDVKALSSLPLLESIKVSMPLLKAIKLKNVESLSRCEHLRSLDLERIRDFDFRHLKRCDVLEKIRFVPYYMKYIDISSLRKCKSLKSIDVTHRDSPPRSGGYGGGKHGLIGIRLPSSDSLEYLDLSNNLFVSKYMLTEWRMSYRRMAEDVKKKHLLDLSQLKKSSNLTKIRISNNPRLLAIDLSELEGNDQVLVDLRMTPVREYHLGDFHGKVIFGHNPDRRLV